MAKLGSNSTRWWLMTCKPGDVVYVKRYRHGETTTVEVTPVAVKKVNHDHVILEDGSQFKLDGFSRLKADDAYAMHPIEVEQAKADAAVATLKAFDWSTLSREDLADLVLQLQLM